MLAVQQPLVTEVVAWAPQRVICKKCSFCGNYFEGDLDGEYSCPECRANSLGVHHAVDDEQSQRKRAAVMLTKAA